MEEKRVISIPKYASQQRLTMHKVIQQVRSGELESVIKEVDGKEVTLIVVH